MNAIVLMKGKAMMARTTKDRFGNILSSIPARFETTPDGGSIGIAEFDPDTMEVGSVIPYGDYDAAGYLGAVLKNLAPRRTLNIPNLEAIIKKAVKSGDEGFLCEHCGGGNCRDCIVQEWETEARDESETY